MDPSEATRLPTFLVEAYAAAMTREGVAAAIARVELVAGELRRDGEQVEYLGALFVPDDEVVFHVVAAQDVRLVRVLCSRSAVTSERIVESILIGGAPRRPLGPEAPVPPDRAPRVRAAAIPR
jgi:hypothetical protein